VDDPCALGANEFSPTGSLFLPRAIPWSIWQVVYGICSFHVNNLQLLFSVVVKRISHG
jgi:hypothetical protein